MALIYRVRATLAGWPGGPGVMTTYHRAGTTPTAIGAQAASDRVRGALDVVKSIWPNLTTATMQAGVDVLEDTTGELQQSLSTIPLANVVGTAATVYGPTQVMAGLVLNCDTIIAGRRLRGRINVGPLAETLTRTAAPPAGVLTAVNAMGVALVTIAPPATTAPLVVWSRPVRNAQGTLIRAGSHGVVLSSTTNVRWFTLRSRQQ